jgi:hypothetical protein
MRKPNIKQKKNEQSIIGNLFLKMGVSKGEDGLNAVMLGVAMIFFFLGVMVLAFS